MVRVLPGRLCEGVSTVSRPLDWFAIGGKAELSDRERVGDVEDGADLLDVESAERRFLFGPKF